MTIPYILIAEDDEEDRMLIEASFSEQQQQYPLHFVFNGIEALDYLSTRAADTMPCLIILDLNMPRMNGTETLRELKKQELFRDIPVVIFSTSINEIERQECIRIGAADYVTKPMTYQEGIDTATYFAKLAQSSVVI